MQALKQNKEITRSASYLCCCFVFSDKIKMASDGGYRFYIIYVNRMDFYSEGCCEKS